MTVFFIALLSLTAHAESCEMQYEHAKANGANVPWCHSIVKPDALAGDYCLIYEGPTVAPSAAPSPAPSQAAKKPAAPFKSTPKPTHGNPSAKRTEPAFR